MTGAVLVGPPVTVIENAGSATVLVPSLTPITMLEVVVTVVGVPLSRPLRMEKFAHAGLLAMLKVSVLPSASWALGLNE
jgi:hypothetical protein